MKLGAKINKSEFYISGILTSLITVTIYFLLLYYIYVVELRRWDYLGFNLGPPHTLPIILCILATASPLLLLKQKVYQPSSFLVWGIYFFVYMPTIVYPVLQWLRDDVPILTAAVCCGFLLTLTFTYSKPKYLRIIRLSMPAFWLLFWSIYIWALGHTVMILGGAITFADLTNVYDQRALSGQLASGTLVGYSIGTLSGCLNPFLMSVGLLYRRKIYFIVGAFGQVFIYSTIAMKSILLTIIVIPALYMLCFRNENIRWQGLAAFSSISILFPLVLGQFLDVDTSLFYENIAAIVFMRTYGMVGALSGVYYDFFSQNPQTFFSHIRFIGELIPYPYQESIGQVIGSSMGFHDLNANANFIATDGIAAMGSFGILIMGAVVGLVFRFVDSFIPRENIILFCCSTPPALMNLANSSFFTTLLTGGFGLLIIICSISPLQKNRNDIKIRPV